MDVEATNRIEPEVWQRNIEALRTVDRLLAENLAGIQLDDAARPVLGRDGRTTFRHFTAGRAGKWLGRTSMPSVSGPALLDNFDAGNGNVLLPSAGQGIELLLLLDRLPAHRAVIVLERELPALAMVLRLYDFSLAIRQGRLILLADEEPDVALSGFLARSPGYLVPERILGWPWMTPAEHQRIRLAVERSAALAARARDQHVAGLRSRLAELAPADPSPPIRCVVLGMDASPATARRAVDLMMATESLQWDGAMCIPDRPAHGLTTAHIEMVLRHRPAFAILVNHLRGQYGQMLPESLPLVSLVDANLPIAADVLRWMGPRDLLFVESTEALRRLTAGDGGKDAADRVLHLPAAANTMAFYPSGDRAISPDAPERVHVAVIADGCDLSASANGLNLPSHAALWDAVRREISRDQDHFWPDTVRPFVLRGEKTVRIRLEDEALRTAFVDTLVRRAGLTLLWRILIEALLGERLTVGLWGSGWESHEPLKPCLRGPVKDLDHRRRIFQSAAVVVSVDFARTEESDRLDALAAGALVLVRRPASAGRTPPSTAGLPAPPGFHTVRQLLTLVKKYCDAPAERERALAPLRNQILSTATWQHRLTAILNRLQARH